MYYMISVLIGCITAIMVAINGKLTAGYGMFTATVIIHIVGTVFSFLLIKIQNSKTRSHGTFPRWFYLGGAIGVFTTVANNFAFGKISMTSIIALGLFGQTLTSICIDHLGLFGMPKYKFRKSNIIGFTFAAAGIVSMLDHIDMTAVIAMLFALGTGTTIVLSRTVNARLAEQIGALRGSFINHLVGLPVTVLILFLFGRKELIHSSASFPTAPWIYIGGMFGVLIVLLCNITAPKIQSFYMTLLTFVGQVFVGILIDILITQNYSAATFRGGILVACGILINLIMERRYTRSIR
ncbi:MAG: DMT family transporter [Clostridium sp.]